MWADSLSRSKYYQLTIVVHSKTVFRLCLYKDFFIISVSISCFFTIQAWIFVSIVHKYVGCCISRVQSEIKEGIIEMHSITNTWTHHKLSLKSSVTAYKITRPSQNLRLTRNLSLFSLRIQRSRSHWNDFKSFINVWLTLHKRSVIYSSANRMISWIIQNIIWHRTELKHLTGLGHEYDGSSEKPMCLQGRKHLCHLINNQILPKLSFHFWHYWCCSAEVPYTLLCLPLGWRKF